MLKILAGEVVSPILYWINPVYAGQQALRGMLRRQGVDTSDIRLAASRELAELAYSLSAPLAFVRGKTRIEKFYAELDLYAIEIRVLLHQQNLRGPVPERFPTGPGYPREEWGEGALLTLADKWSDPSAACRWSFTGIRMQPPSRMGGAPNG